ncbi:MAG: ATP-dependent RecD-like DNA helicase [Actinobacteria bacterium]|nr:ATP-dependent RecD-like DNA helicase [Actinomycetota bacterium]MBL7123752.1 ATP-dependent RecD-like DNA helicase [Actinomycetota bacterium]
MNNQKSKIRGILEKIIFKNSETGFIVGKVRLEDNSLVTIVGNAFELQCGEKLEVTGKWILNRNYGQQFEIESIKTTEPATAVGIENYLGSGLIKGIGPVMANRIVSHFKLDTLKILDEEPKRLNEIDGIGKKRINLISKSWKKHKNIREVMIFLQSYGISNTYATKIYNNYGDNSINVIKVNPYRLSEDIFGIGFKTADKIALKTGIEKDSLFRIKAGIIHLLKSAEDEGHCYFPYEEFIEIAENFLCTELGKIIDALSKLEGDGRIIIVKDNVSKVYLASIYNAEKYVSEKILALLDDEMEHKMRGSKKDGIYDLINNLAAKERIILDDIQIKAIEKAVTEKILVITGSPGTGKSTILNFVIKIFEKENKSVILGAPTGRASKRLCETTGKEAKTIHRLLNYNPKLNKFLKNEKNPINADIVIIDEASMLDIRLMRNLLLAIKTQTCVIFVGDVDQLPAVGPGNVLSDIISSGIVPVIELKNIYRQEGESLIIHNAHKVRDGQFPYIGKPKNNDFFFIEKEEPEEVVDLILNLITQRIPKSFNYNPLYDVQVLVPTNKGIVGVNNLNSKIQDILNFNSQKVLRGSVQYRLNDKVIQLKNNYEKDVYNGDIGFISGIDMEMEEITVNFDGRTVDYSFFELDEISLSYAISIHKSQGSEFKCVIIPILTSHYMLLQRNLLYTAITRARELTVIVGSKKAIGMAVNRNIVEKRYTGLKELLRNF